MNTYKFTLNDKDITKDILEFEYSENLDDVASSFKFLSLKNFDITSTDNNGNKSVNIIKIYADKQVIPFFVGVITDYEHTTDKNIYLYSGFDFGFYLNKNQVIIQYKTEINLKTAIESLCSLYDIKLEDKNNSISAELPDFKAKVKKIYKNVQFADVIKDLIKIEKDKNGLNDVYIDCKNGLLNIRQYQIEKDLTAIIGNGFLVNSKMTYSNIKTTKSIQEMKNKVFVADNNEKSVVYKEAIDNESVRVYGLLSTIETVDSSKYCDAQHIADTKLKELRQVKEEISLSLLGDYKISKGKLIDFTISEYDLKGIYLVKSASHKITNEKELVNISIAKRTSS